MTGRARVAQPEDLSTLRTGGVVEFAPTLVHALGDRSGGRVRFIGPTNLLTYRYVSCEHPQELLDVLMSYSLPDHWLEDDEGSVFRVGCMYGAEIEGATTREPAP